MAKLQLSYEPPLDVSNSIDNGPRDMNTKLMLNWGRAVVNSSRRYCTNQPVELQRAWVGARPTAARLID